MLGAGCWEEARLGIGCQKNGFTFGGWGFEVGGVLGLGLVLGPVLVPVHGPVLRIVLGPVLGLYLGVGCWVRSLGSWVCLGLGPGFLV